MKVTVNASPYSFKLYESGIFDEEYCQGANNHAMTIIGYGTEPNKHDIHEPHNYMPYWIVKNSFGLDWGEDGYMRVKVTPGTGVCGIQATASWVTPKAKLHHYWD